MSKKKKRKLKTQKIKSAKEIYYSEIEEDFINMNHRFDDSCFLIFLWNGICALIYWALYNGMIDSFYCNKILQYIVYFVGVLLRWSVFCCVIHTLSMIFKKTKKTFALAISSVLILFMLNLNLGMFIAGIHEFQEWTQWISIVVYLVLSFFWFIYTINKIKEDISGKEKIPKNVFLYKIRLFFLDFDNVIKFFVVILVIFALFPYFKYFMNRNLSLLYILGYFIFVLNILMTRLVLNSILYCIKKFKK